MTKIKISDLYHSERLSGILLIMSFLAAIFVANLQYFQEIYKSFVFYPITFGYGRLVYKAPLIEIVNDGLMTWFFLLIGLELKFHLTRGEFHNKKNLVLPGAAATGGMILPAFFYLTLNLNHPNTINGWAIPIATDTAFMLGILSFFSEIISIQLRAFIIGFSLIDDAISLLILAIFYTNSSSVIPMMADIILISLLFLLNRFKVTNSFYYLAIGIILWFSMVESGIHGTLCGIILALAIPVEKDGQINSSFSHLEKCLRPIVYFLILPLFAFINSGVSFDFFSFDILTTPLSLGIILGLFIGKQLGILLFSCAMVKLNYCSLPENVSWTKFYSISVLGGIGFTLSLFIGDLTFESSQPNYVMRISVILGSLLSALIGVIILAFLKKRS